MYEVILPNGDTAQAPTLDAAMLAVETLIEDACNYLRDNLVIRRDGEFDSSATTMAQSKGLLV